LHSPTYIPADREFANLMQAEGLEEWLCRFDNYKRVLRCSKPGRKPLGEQQASSQEEDNANVLNVNQYFNPRDKTDSVNRITNTAQDELSKETSNPSTPEEGEEVTAPLTIGREEQKEIPYTAGGNKQENTYPNPNEEETEEQAPDPAKDVNFSKKSTSNEKAAAALEHVIPAAHWRKLHGSGSPRAPRRMKHVIPDHIQASIKDLSREMGESPQIWKSNVTRAAKLYFTGQQVYGTKRFTARYWHGLVSQARSQARARTNIKYYNEETNSYNYMPYFWTCFENLLGFTAAELAYARSKEPLYADSDIKEFVKWYHHQQANQGDQARE
jgi:hypothetical protein